MENHDYFFQGEEIALVQSAETMGNLPEILNEIAIELENHGIPTSLSGGGYLLADSLRQDFLPLYWLLRAVSLITVAPKNDDDDK